MNILEVIQNIQKQISNPQINNGGCIHFAYYLSKALKRYGFEHKVIAIERSYDACYLKELLKYQEGCMHIVVYIKGIGYVDATNIYSKLSEYAKFEIVSISIPRDYDLNKLRNNRHIWNSCYNKSYNYNLKSIITSSFKQIEYVKLKSIRKK